MHGKYGVGGMIPGQDREMPSTYLLMQIEHQLLPQLVGPQLFGPQHVELEMELK